MKNLKKTGILIAILVVPVLVFVMMKVFFVNEFIHLEIINPQVEGCKLNLVEGKHQVPYFEGKNQLGEVVSSDQLKGNVIVTNFFNASENNKQLGFSMARALERFKNEDEVLLLSHTLNPENDSVAVLKAFADIYKVTTNKWLFLQSEQKAINQLIKCGYGANLIQKGKQFRASQFVLIDKVGHIRGYYDGLDRKEMNRLMDEIALLLLEYQKQRS